MCPSRIPCMSLKKIHSGFVEFDTVIFLCYNVRIRRFVRNAPNPIKHVKGYVMTNQSINHNLPIVNRADAKASGLSRYFTGIPCIHDHTVQRQVSNGSCVECVSDGWRRYIDDNPFALMDAAEKYRKSEKGRIAHNRANAKYRAKMRADNVDWLPL